MFYKVVSNKDGVLKSAIAHRNQQASIDYLTKQWVTPRIKNSQIFIFDNLDKAFTFLRCEDYSLELWECQAADVHPMSEAVAIDLICDFWEDKKVDMWQIGCTPPGTYGCSAVKLERKLFPYYKVVTSQLFSARSGNNPRVSVQYSNSDFVKAPENTKLFVFDKLEDAKDFLWLAERLFSCVVKNPSPGLVPAAVEYINKFWAEFYEHIENGGTVENFTTNIKLSNQACAWADEVKLVNEIL
jgi:hypothetical protein